VAQTSRHKAPPRAWTTRETATLRRMVASGLHLDTIAATLNRTPEAVRKTAYRLRISLRQPGETRGLILGQPRRISWSSARQLGAHITALQALRADVIAGRVQPAELEQIARRHKLLAEGAPICPRCTSRPQEIDRTGLCTECHILALAEAHRTDSDRKQAKRTYDREKQAAHRRRKKGTTP
jgi:hypothetical protein